MAHDAGAVCLCVASHRPPFLEPVEHHVWPSGMGGPDIPENRIWICDNTHRSTHELLRLMVTAGRELSYYELQQIEDRPVSRYAAALAREGFRRWRAGAATP